MSDRAIRELYPIFSEAVQARLIRGAQEYGDRSFTRAPAELVSEIEQELYDLMGWTFILWCRLRELASCSPPDRSQE